MHHIRKFKKEDVEIINKIAQNREHLDNDFGAFEQKDIQDEGEFRLSTNPIIA
jgi:hypothetical protein